MQWSFTAWGVDTVLAGHDHTYESLLVDGIPYFVNGLGGGRIYELCTLSLKANSATTAGKVRCWFPPPRWRWTLLFTTVRGS